MIRDKIILLCLFLLFPFLGAASDAFSSPSHYQYPPIAIQSAWNSTEVMEIIYSLDPELYKHVDIIEFVNDPISYGINKTAAGQMGTRWGSDHNCYDTWILIWDPYSPQTTLIHELGHVYEYCELKRNESTEEFANAYPFNRKDKYSISYMLNQLRRKIKWM